MSSSIILFSLAAALLVRWYATRAMQCDPAMHALFASMRHKAWF